MKSKCSKQFYRGWNVAPLVIVWSLILSGCTSTTLGNTNAQSDVMATFPMSPLLYHQLLSRMTPAELGRERMVLAALPNTPNTQVRTAMLLGYPRAHQDLAKAISLLDGVLKSTDPVAAALHPLARLLADNYSERQRMDANLDKQGVQLKESLRKTEESQRKAVELQEKIEGLADIERTLPPRPRAGRVSGTGGAR